MQLNKIIERAKALLLNPKEEWQKILAESDDYKKPVVYVAVVSLAPAIALFLGYGVVGMPTMYGYFRMPLISAFFSAFVFYFLTGLAVGLTALMMGFFSNYFIVEGKWPTYLKLSAYASTAPILANVILLLPFLKFIRILGFYGCVTMFVGLPLLLKIPKDKEMQYVVTILVSAIIISLVFVGLTDQFLGPIYSEIL